jgi:hypothetical protein
MGHFPIRSILAALCKYLFDVLPPIQHAHDLKDIIHDPVEDDMRARGKRPESRAQFISRPPYKRMIFDGGNHLADLAENFFCRVPAGDALVVIPNLSNIDDRFRRPNGRASTPGHITGSFVG